MTPHFFTKFSFDDHNKMSQKYYLGYIFLFYDHLNNDVLRPFYLPAFQAKVGNKIRIDRIINNEYKAPSSTSGVDD